MSKSLDNPFLLIVRDELNKLPKPQKVIITKVYEDNQHIDCKTLNDEILTYVPVITNNLSVNNIGILIFLENDERIVITK